MDHLDFTEEEIREQLALLGYKNIPTHRLLEFKKDLDELLQQGEWRSLTSPTLLNSNKSQTAASRPSPPAYTKEKVSQRYFEDSHKGFFLHAGHTDHDRQVLTTYQNGDYGRQRPCDSYAQHSVAPKLQLPPGAPNRLQLEPDTDDSLQQTLTDSYVSSPGAQERRFIRRKVLRKHKGQSLVCDESVYSEDSALGFYRSVTKHTSARVQVATMYKIYDTQSDKEDKNSLFSSFWSDEERQEEDEEEGKKVETEQEIRGKDIIPVSHTENSLKDGLEEKETTLDNQDNKRRASDEDKEQKEIKVHQVIGNDGLKPPSDTENSLQEATDEERFVSNKEDDESSYSSEDGSDEDEEEEEDEISEEDSKYVTDTEGSSQEASEEEDEQDSSSGDNLESEDEGEEEEELNTGEEDSTSAKGEEDSLQEAPEVEKQELKSQENQTGPSSRGGSDEEEENKISEEDIKAVSEDSTKGASEEERQELRGEEEEEELDTGEEDSTPAEEEEESLQEASEEERQELEHQENQTSTSSGGGSDEEGNEEENEVSEDSQKEASEEEKPDLMEQEKKNSDSSGSRSDKEEEEGAEHSIIKDDLEPDGDKEDVLQEGNCDLSNQDGFEDRDDEEEKSYSSRFDSPAPSMMTSGYGTYRPEEQEGGDYRDDHTITEFDQDSQGDLSEVRYEDDNETLCSFGGFEIETTEPDFTATPHLSVLESAKLEADAGICRADKEVDITDMKTEEDKEQTDEILQRAVSKEDEQNNKEENVGKEVEDRAESDGSSSNKDIKFIDSKAELSSMTYNDMFEGWEGNLRHKKDVASCLEERLADIHLSSPSQRDFETENEDISCGTLSSEAEGVSVSAFDSYIRGMTRSRSDGDIRPKPKSFIRPVMNQQTLKKTDPVAKYFQYKQLWEMFKLPGESDRRALRQEIKEQLAYQPPPPKPRKVFVPNTYIVPTEKKRSALRWEIRTDLANGVMPHKLSYRF